MNKQIEEMAKDLKGEDYAVVIVQGKTASLSNQTKKYLRRLIDKGYRKITENEVVISKEDKRKLLKEMYEQGKYDAIADLEKDGKVIISKEEYEELINLQQTHAKDLTNAIQSYEEKKADLKLEYNNHIKNLEKIIDRQSKDLNSQADRLIDLKEQLKEMEEQRDKQAYITEDLIQDKHLCIYQARKVTAREILKYIEQTFDEEWCTVDCVYDIHEWIRNTFDVDLGE